GSDKGLGYVILSATSYWKTELAFSSMILLSLMAILLFGAVSLVERLVCPWLAPAGDESTSVGEREGVRRRTPADPTARRRVWRRRDAGPRSLPRRHRGPHRHARRLAGDRDRPFTGRRRGARARSATPGRTVRPRAGVLVCAPAASLDLGPMDLGIAAGGGAARALLRDREARSVRGRRLTGGGRARP